MRNFGIPLVLAMLLVASGPAKAGHEAPVYPSYYPQEITIETADPKAAAALLERTKIHAYVGAQPEFAGPVPSSVRHIESLGSFLIVRVNPAAAGDEKTACAVVAAVNRSMAAGSGGFTPHPYPITPLHADYLHHADLASVAKDRFSTAAAADGIKVRAKGARAIALAHGRWPIADADWDAEIEELDLAGLLAAEDFRINGWMGPPWQKEGWHHAYLLLAPSLSEPAARARAQAIVRRLRAPTTADAVERINLERDLVALLTAGCRLAVAGYAMRREYYSAEYSEGVENVAHDSHIGLNSPIFLRTVKLKDFPWNGWLRLGVPAPPAAAWNPFGGFDDPMGRLIWSALGDPALFPNPYGAGWTLNRIGDVQPAGRR